MKKDNNALWQKLYDELRGDIILDNFHSGQQLTESFLAEKYGVSRTPIRDALKRLEREGLVEIVHNRGAFVVGLSKREKRDMFDIWNDLETRALDWSIKRGQEEEREYLKELYDLLDFHTVKKDALKVMSISLLFHEQIINMSRNTTLSLTMENYFEYIRILTSKNFLDESELSYFLRYHYNILDGIRNRDVEDAQESFQEFINFIKNNHIL